MRSLTGLRCRGEVNKGRAFYQNQVYMYKAGFQFMIEMSARYYKCHKRNGDYYNHRQIEFAPMSGSWKLLKFCV